MIEMMVMDADAPGDERGLGRKGFRVMPRVGDYVFIEDREGSAVYQVVAVLYWENDRSPGIDLYVRGRMSELEMIAHIRNTSRGSLTSDA